MLTEFQKDLQKMTLNEALNKHNLTLKEAINQITLPRKRYKPKKNPQNKYIQSRDKKYYLRKWVNGKTKQFGTYYTIHDARTIRDTCQKEGWIQKNIDRYCKQHHIQRCPNPKSKARYS